MLLAIGRIWRSDNWQLHYSYALTSSLNGTIVVLPFAYSAFIIPIVCYKPCTSMLLFHTHIADIVIQCGIIITFRFLHSG